MRKFFHTIRARILLCTISMILLISIIITAISYFIVSYNLRQNMIRTSEIRLSFLGSSIDSNINNVKGFIDSCQRSNKISKFAIEKNTANKFVKREALDFVTEIYGANTALSSQIIRLVIIGKSRNDIIQIVEAVNSNIAVSSEAILSLPYFDTLYENTGEISTAILSDPFFTTKTVPVIPILHTIEHPYQAGEIGYIFTEMSASVITDPIRNSLSDTDNCLYFRIGEYFYRYIEGQGLVLCSDEFEIIEDLSGNALSSNTDIQKIRNRAEQKTYIMVTRPLGTRNLYVTECLDEYTLSRDIFSTFLIVTLIILTASAVIGILLFYYLSKTVNVPVKQLQVRMRRIADGDFSRDPSTEWEHELGDIGKNINDLSENVLSLMNQRLEDERQKKDYEYRMLQSQINPHFLYNTLNSIKWMATIQNATGIAEMTTALSRLLRDISKGTTSLVPISHEISLIEDYFTIQQYRYGGVITLSFDIEDERLTGCSILKFTLQPIVENAIFHGIEPKGSAGTIAIHIYQDAHTDVHIDVTDDGIGMEPEVADHLLDHDSSAGSSFFKEIGVSNVHKRLQYEFGNSYGLHITSKKGEFTTVSILLPFQAGEVGT
jgi:Predicted signal transduction protein with a C-terminal ATPase domain